VEVQISVALMKQIVIEVAVYIIKIPIKFVVFWALGKLRNRCRSRDSTAPKAQTKIELDISVVSMKIAETHSIVRGLGTVPANLALDHTHCVSLPDDT